MEEFWLFEEWGHDCSAVAVTTLRKHCLPGDDIQFILIESAGLSTSFAMLALPWRSVIRICIYTTVPITNSQQWAYKFQLRYALRNCHKLFVAKIFILFIPGLSMILFEEFLKATAEARIFCSYSVEREKNTLLYLLIFFAWKSATVTLVLGKRNGAYIGE